MATRGFTLVEMLFVLAIGGILFAIAAPAVERFVDKSRVAETIIDIGELSKKIKQVEMATGALPADLAAIQYERKSDPWGRPYEFVDLRLDPNKARKDKKLKPLNSDFDLYSVGPDGVSARSLNHRDSRDDIVRARDGGFVGTAEEFDPL